jgi:hypothetical protein
MLGSAPQSDSGVRCGEALNSLPRTPPASSEMGARAKGHILTSFLEGYTSVSRVLILAAVRGVEITLLPQQTPDMRRSDSVIVDPHERAV